MWTFAANWSPNGIPAATTAVQFTGTGPFGIDLNGSRTTLSMLFSGTSGYTFSNGSLTISSGTIYALSPSSGAVTHTIAGNVAFGNAAAIFADTNSIVSLTGTITGSSLSKTGDGTLILGGTTSFSNGATVTGGTLQIGNGGTTGAFSNMMSVSSGAAIAFKRSDAYVVDTSISGAGNVIQNGGNTLRFTTDQAFTGTLVINSGNASVGAGSTVNTFAAQAIVNSGNLIFNTPNDLTYAGTISGGGTLFKVSSNTLTLTGALNSTGNASLEGGTLKLAGTFNSGTYTGNIVTSAGTTLHYAKSANQTLSGAISGSGSLVVDSGLNILTLSGSNTYTGDTTITNGALTVSGVLGGGNYAGNIFLGASFNYTGTAVQTLSGRITGASALVQVGTGALTLTGTSSTTGSVYTSGTGGLFITSGSHAFSDMNIGLYYTGGSGLVTVTGPSTTVKTNNSTWLGLGYNGSNQYSGSLTITNGARYEAAGYGIQIGSSNAVGSNVIVTGSAHLYATNIYGTQTFILDQGTLHFTESGTLSVASTKILSGGGIIDTGTYSVTASSAISGPGNLTKTGSGTLAITGSFDSTGNTAIEAGTLKLAGTLSSGTYGGNIAISQGAKLHYAKSTNQTLSGAISGSGSLIVDSGLNILTLSGSSTYTGDTTITSGALTISGVLGGGNCGGNISLGASFNYTGTAAQTLSGRITGASALVQVGTGALTLTGTSSTTGSVYTSGTGGVFITSGSHAFSDVNIGLYYTGGSGLVTVTGPSTTVKTNNSTWLGLGYNGSNQYSGSLTITNGARYEAAGYGIQIGSSNATGSNVTVTGSAHLYTTDIYGTQTFTLDEGTVHFTKSGSLSVASTRILSGGGIIDTGTYSVTASSAISGPGILTKTGSGTLAITGSFDSTGNTAIQAGTLKLASTFSSGTYGGNITISQGAKLHYAKSANQTLSGAISGSGSLIVDSGLNILTLSGSNTYTGDTTIASGALTISGVLGGGDYAGNISLGASFNYTGTAAQTLSGRITGGSALVQVGTGVLTLTGTSSTTGSVYTSGTGGLFITSGSHAFSDMNIGLYYTGGSGLVTVTGPSTTVKTTNSTWLGLGYNGSNQYSGSLTITNGARYEAAGYGVQIGSSNATGSNVTVTGSAHLYAKNIYGTETFTLDQGTVHFTESGSLSVASTRILAGGGVIDTGTYGVTASTVISGSGNLTKTGSGTLALTSVNTASGTMTVSEGTLVIKGNYAGDAVVSAAARLAGSGTIGGELRIGGTVCPGNSPGILSAGSVSLEENGALIFEINDATGTVGTNWDLLDAAGILAINSSDEEAFTISLRSLTASNSAGELANFDPLQYYSWTFLTADGGISGYAADKFSVDASGFLNEAPGTWSVNQMGNSLALVYVVPEPSAMCLLLGGFSILLMRRRRNAQRTQSLVGSVTA